MRRSWCLPTPDLTSRSRRHVSKMRNLVRLHAANRFIVHSRSPTSARSASHTERRRAETVGYGARSAPNVGPLTTTTIHRARCWNYQMPSTKGGKITTGGNRSIVPATSCQPTVSRHPPRSVLTERSRPFAPGNTLSTEQEAIDIANAPTSLGRERFGQRPAHPRCAWAWHRDPHGRHQHRCRLRFGRPLRRRQESGLDAMAPIWVSRIPRDIHALPL